MCTGWVRGLRHLVVSPPATRSPALPRLTNPLRPAFHRSLGLRLLIWFGYFFALLLYGFLSVTLLDEANRRSNLMYLGFYLRRAFAAIFGALSLLPPVLGLGWGPGGIAHGARGVCAALSAVCAMSVVTTPRGSSESAGENGLILALSLLPAIAWLWGAASS
jgi:hypothetical protein